MKANTRSRTLLTLAVTMMTTALWWSGALGLGPCPMGFWPDGRGCCPEVINGLPYYRDGRGCYPRVFDGVAYWPDGNGCVSCGSVVRVSCYHRVVCGSDADEWCDHLQVLPRLAGPLHKVGGVPRGSEVLVQLRAARRSHPHPQPPSHSRSHSW
jgi:hypothetical protein